MKNSVSRTNFAKAKFIDCYYAAASGGMEVNMTSKFIVFEGIDGAGKTTQIKLLKQSLAERGIECVTTAEPTEMPSGKKIREALSGRVKVTCAEMADMFATDRVIHNKDKEQGIDVGPEEDLCECFANWHSYVARLRKEQASECMLIRGLGMSIDTPTDEKMRVMSEKVEI